MRCAEAQELITALVDNELVGAERSSIESHLKECAGCRFVYGQEQALKVRVRVAGAGLGAPAELRAKILADPRLFADRAKPRRLWRGLASPWRPAPYRAFALAAAILLVLPVFYLIQPSPLGIALSALETHSRIASGAISLVKAASQEELKKKLTLSVEGTFAPMGYDLSAMGLRAVGGITREVKGRKILVAVYEGTGPMLTCYTFLGAEADAPESAGVFLDPHKQINFYLFSRGGMNGVLHREGDLICILVSKMPMSDLLDLARSKARPS